MEAHGQPLRGLRWAEGASLSFLRTEMPLRDIPVFRMAYFTIKPYYGLISKTLMLQVRSAHPPMPHRNVFSKHPGVPLGLFGKPKRSSFSRVRGLHQAILWPLLQNARPPGSLRSPSDAAPKCFSKLSGVPLGLFGKPKRSSSSRFAAFGGRGELRSPLHPPLPPPHTGQAGAKGTERAPWLPCIRGAVCAAD